MSLKFVLIQIIKNMKYLLQSSYIKIHFIVYLISSVILSYFQTTNDILLHRKYWYFKSRLNND
jgi:hypothetical protein